MYPEITREVVDQTKLVVDLDDVTAFSPFYSEEGKEYLTRSIIKVKEIGDIVVRYSFKSMKELKGIAGNRMGF